MRLKHLLLPLGMIFTVAACEDDPTTPETTGTLTVTVTTTGGGVDEDGYLLAVDDEGSVTVEANATIDFDDVSVGGHTVTLSDVDAPCMIVGDATVSVEVEADTPGTAAFSVDCTEG